MCATVTSQSCHALAQYNNLDANEPYSPVLRTMVPLRTYIRVILTPPASGQSPECAMVNSEPELWPSSLSAQSQILEKPELHHKKLEV